MTNMHGKNVLIIGGTSGFGLRVAELVGAEGAHVVITGRDTEKLSRVVASMRAKGYAVDGDVFNATTQESIDDFFAHVNVFDHMVSVAGGFMGGGFLEADMATIRRTIEEKLFVNTMIGRSAAKKINDGGSMVFTSGSGGKAHTASGAIVANESMKIMVQGFAVELAPHVRVNAVAPTWTKTPLWRDMPEQTLRETEAYFTKAIALQRTATIDEVADVYLFLMKNSFITGQTITIDGGLTLM